LKRAKQILNNKIELRRAHCFTGNTTGLFKSSLNFSLQSGTLMIFA
jgi:hypothetical protein